MYYNPQLYQPITSPFLYYYPPLIYFSTQNTPITTFNLPSDTHHILTKHTSNITPTTVPLKPPQIIKEKGETCESFSQIQSKRKNCRKQERIVTTPTFSIPSVKSKEVKLTYRIQWRNENRNIVPNLVNQMISFLLKQSKSMKLIQRLFDRIPHPRQCTFPRYYQYVKKIKQSVTHYVNESIFLHFLEIHEPKCQLYALEEQQFYMKICRIVILSFLRNEIKLISLTSKRMSEAKRKIHLIARQALESKFIQLCRTTK